MTSNRRLAFQLLLALCCFSSLQTGAQTNTATPAVSPDQRAQAIIDRAVEVVGGNNYLNVRTMVSRGLYSNYHDGLPQVPAKFLDYIVYPDKERTEFTSAGIRVVQTNSGVTGWLFDGATKSINDMKPAQIEDFRRGIRTSVDNLLRGWWRKEGAVLSYAGRREAGLAKRNETVRLTYPDGFWIEYEFGARDGLPAKVIYKRTRKHAESDVVEEITEEDHLAKPITIDGITSSFVIDHFINGKQTSRINYESVEYNRPVPDSLFSKPESIKAIK